MINLAILFCLLFATWALLSGISTISYLTICAISCAIAVFFYKMIYKDEIRGLLLLVLRILRYSLWLIKEITKSSIDVSLKMWQLEPEISPQMVWIPCDFKDDVGYTIFANSITLTPGTVTIGTKKGMLYVHSLTAESMEILQGGNMLGRLQKVTEYGDK